MAPYRAGIIPERVNPRGYDPSLLERLSNVPERPKKQTALQKHKAWLRQLQASRAEIKDSMLVGTLEKEERRQQFADNQRELREAIKGVIEEAEVEASGGGGGRSAPTFSVEADGGDAAAPPSAGVGAGAASGGDAKKKGKKGKKGALDRPAWALSETQHEAKEEEEAEDLLEFVKELDLDHYIDDVEVRASLEAARRRVEELAAKAAAEAAAAEEEEEDDDEEEGEEVGGGGYAAPRRVGHLTDAALRLHDASTGSVGGGGGGDDSKSLADTVLSSASSIRQVHSKKSLAAVIERAKSKASGLEAIAEEGGALPRVEPPVVAVINDVADGIAAKKKLVSQLPYMNRNPSV